MKIIIPMAGMGNRFLDQKYKEPKPLIYVNKKRIIEYILEMFDKNDDFIFICNSYHLNTTNMKQVLLDLKPNAKIISIPQHKNGPVYTVLACLDMIDDSEEVLISYCDSPFIWNQIDFKHYIHQYNLDGCLITHTGFHPHTIETTKMAFVKEQLDNYPLISEVKEKESYTNTPEKEHASSGAYYFKYGLYIKKYFKDTIKYNLNYNGEYYITLVYNLCINDNLKIGYYDIPIVTMFGTPESVENFESWMRILRGDQCKNIYHITECYNYWKKYYENYIS